MDPELTVHVLDSMRHFLGKSLGFLVDAYLPNFRHVALMFVLGLTFPIGNPIENRGLPT